MTYQMNRPDQTLAHKILSTVPYRDRLPAGRLMPPVGMLRSDVRSLQELRLLLTPDVRSLPGINLNNLANWVKGVVGDTELAHALRKATEDTGSYVEGCLRVYELVGLRLQQAREVAGQEVLA